jgi:hypothetical protein
MNFEVWEANLNVYMRYIKGELVGYSLRIGYIRRNETQWRFFGNLGERLCQGEIEPTDGDWMETALGKIAGYMEGLHNTKQERDLKPLDDHHYNELVQAVGIINHAGQTTLADINDGLPTDQKNNMERILRQVIRLAAVINQIRGYGSVSFEEVKAEYEAGLG